MTKIDKKEGAIMKPQKAKELLYQYIKKGKLKQLESLLKSGVNPNVTRELDTYSEYAADEGDFQRSWDRKKRSAEYYDYEDGYGSVVKYTPLDYALSRKNYKAANILLQYGADVNFNPESIKFLVSANCFYEAQTVDYLISHGFDVTRRHEKNRTELHELIWKTAQKYFFDRGEELKKSVGSLLKAGVDVNAVDEYGNTALHMLLKIKPSSVVRNIIDGVLENGADVTKKDAHGKSAFQLLLENEEFCDDEELKRLLSKGNNIKRLFSKGNEGDSKKENKRDFVINAMLGLAITACCWGACSQFVSHHVSSSEKDATPIEKNLRHQKNHERE